MPLPTKSRPNKARLGLRRMHQEMNSEAASSSLRLRAAVPPKRARVEEEVQTNETMQDLNGTIVELEKTRRKLYEMTKTMLSTEDDHNHARELTQTTDTRLPATTGRVTIPDPSDTLGDQSWSKQ